MRALVTGGTRGIGAAIRDELYVNLGARVFAPARSNGHDLSNDLGVEMMLERAAQLDDEDGETTTVVVANVGGGGRHGDDGEVWCKNLYAMQRSVEWALPGMLDRKWGRVIAIGSIFGQEIGPPRAVFHAAKAAQRAWVKHWSKDARYVRNGITFNTVAPGNVYVEGKPRVDEEALPMGRMGRPEEVAKLVAFLCSEDAAWINGANIVIDGGESNAL